MPSRPMLTPVASLIFLTEFENLLFVQSFLSNPEGIGEGMEKLKTHLLADLLGCEEFFPSEGSDGLVRLDPSKAGIPVT